MRRMELRWDGMFITYPFVVFLLPTLQWEMNIPV